MGPWMWSAVFFAIALIFAGGVAWWLGRGCAVTITGAVGAIVGGVGSVLCLSLILDPDAAMRTSLVLAGVAGVWLLVFSVAGGIRGQLKERARREAAAELARHADLHRV